MTNKTAEKDGLTDGMPRDRRGNWQPESGTPPPSPLFVWPLKPLALLKWLYNFLFPWTIFYIAIAALTWLYFTPDMAQMIELRPGWILAVLLRNEALLILFVSAFHMRLWFRKSQGYQFKYTSDWLGVGKRKFLWGNQLWDNIFWSCVSGGLIWTAYEVLLLWAYANDWLPYINPQEQPVYFVLWLLLIPLWREFHFYWTHRWLHWPPLYKAAHYLHHKNINVGPWSGMAMHPIEHVIYFSCLLIHVIIPSHPIHMLFNAQHTALTPGQGHAGFDKVVIKENVNLAAGSFFHQLHHRYFECNYGESTIPLDKLFGTFHDGSSEAHQAMRAKQRSRHGKTN